MKKLSEIYKKLGIAFSFPIQIKDDKGYETYWEASDGYWYKYERDANGNATYYEDITDYWARWERDANGKVTYYEDITDYWARWERDANGKVTYFENSGGLKRGTPKVI